MGVAHHPAEDTSAPSYAELHRCTAALEASLDDVGGGDSEAKTKTDYVPELQFPPVRAAGRGRGWYRGDCQVHSARSLGGELTPGQLAAAARGSGLDFIAITEHNTADTQARGGSSPGMTCW